ncbi:MULTISPECIES: class D beta-lactamase [Pseudanabaena]|uniref:beta-lactamase n=2 Tax=Pseudanabaena TaxID=1152 RepID=L8N2W5_9CYAN|nr:MULTISPECIES: class D beta-lactamase [Pseudanabaena]ELS34036.1 Beta-lactamase [Pseudanabaena biceps PCC 7429]MDG3493764.1 class D beta-lactamase [Pseudanabaena catenata USMAC16]
MFETIYSLLFLLCISLAIAPSAFSQDRLPSIPKTNLDFQSQFSRHLAQNLQEAKSEGCFVLYDLKRDRYIRYNSIHCQKRYIPASTFKIFNSLVALETKAIADENTVIPWNGVSNQSFPDWNQDQTMRTAFKRSVVWFYQDLARRAGKERMAKYIEAAGYGNQNIEDKIDTFWLKGKLRISPEEQIKFLVKLYKGDLPFSPAVINTVKDIMVIERQENYTLRGKTGWGSNVDGLQNIGWYVGYVERDNNVYFYALNMTNQDPKFDMISIRKKILFDTLRDLQLVD